MYDSLVLVDGIAYRRYRTKATEQIQLQVLLPPTLQEAVLEKCHANIMGGHTGEHNTFVNTVKREIIAS